MLTEKLAKRLYGSQHAAIGQQMKLHGLQFTVIGTFKERTESFGLSELAAETVLIPITVMRYFVPVERSRPPVRAGAHAPKTSKPSRRR